MQSAPNAVAQQTKWVYRFVEGTGDMKDLLGGKGAGLAEMMRAGLPVPPGFTITTGACNQYVAAGPGFMETLFAEVRANLVLLEKEAGKGFGDPQNPLLVSVRSGAKFSMPGMMDTVLNLGLNETTVLGIIAQTGNARFAYDSYRRFIQMFSNVVLGVRGENFERLLHQAKEKQGVTLDTDLTAEVLQELVGTYKRYLQNEHGITFPEDPLEQLRLSIEAVFKSWNNPRAVTYRNHNRIAHDLGTAVNIQAMVFGNMGNDSGTGVAFTRNPSTGERKLYGEFLLNAQGEDVVAGIRTPRPIVEMGDVLPEVYAQFQQIAQKLETHYRDIQDLEFTIEKGRLFMLQTRSGKRTAGAAVKIAVDMANEGIIDKAEAVQRVDPMSLNQLMHTQIDPNAPITRIAKGLPASPGAASGIVTFEADDAERLGKAGIKVVLVRTETCPDDIHGMIHAQGVLTSRGGMTSHAAVVARGMGKPCVAGCESVSVDLPGKTFTVGDVTVKEGDQITINGSTGEVILGLVPMVQPALSDEFRILLGWADQFRTLGVRANADTPEDAAKALEFGAGGIGLCRTEHMFMAQDRLPVVQAMILARNLDDRRKALGKLLPMQRQDFVQLFEMMAGLPVTIRLLDPPLHEFLPSYKDLLIEVTELRIRSNDAARLKERQALLRRVEELHESNPMMGLRGCRLGLMMPEINEMQVQAIIEAAITVSKKGIKVQPEIMIPLVGHVNELKAVKKQLEATAQEVMAHHGAQVEYRFGTMIEIPRAALTADQIAVEADFFSFGTNDLTQMTFGYSRDDAEGKFLQQYLEEKLLPANPFEILDQEGVGQLIQMAAEKGRKVKPDLKLGICGEHGGEPSSIAFAHNIGLTYVSCSPYRVPIARLAAAQAAIATEAVERDR
ncbi:MAG: pyruvate, phosphate dikinase [Candidatus Sericytochromatia bacterium]|nr:pyruvate, phosphate dikinase [Candidatus Sericytochromatia bacterium]